MSIVEGTNLSDLTQPQSMTLAFRVQPDRDENGGIPQDLFAETEWAQLKLPRGMSRVSVTINGRQFRMACEDGREGYLMNLAREIDNRTNDLRSKFGEIGDTGLMVMLAITMADELAEVRQHIKRLEEELVAISDGNNAAQAAFACDQQCRRAGRKRH